MVGIVGTVGLGLCDGVICVGPVGVGAFCVGAHVVGFIVARQQTDFNTEQGALDVVSVHVVDLGVERLLFTDC